jgi:hypothetical protein
MRTCGEEEVKPLGVYTVYNKLRYWSRSGLLSGQREVEDMIYEHSEVDFDLNERFKKWGHEEVPVERSEAISKFIKCRYIANSDYGNLIKFYLILSLFEFEVYCITG